MTPCKAQNAGRMGADRARPALFEFRCKRAKPIGAVDQCWLRAFSFDVTG